MNTDRFKFRAWSIREHKYYYDIEDTYSNDSSACSDIPNDQQMYPDYHYFFGTIITDPGYIVEQCTGLRDKTGKLIYEGDVVRWYKSTAWGLGGERKGRVFFHDRFFSFGVESTLGDGYSLSEIKEFEIIGNIHGKEGE